MVGTVVSARYGSDTIAVPGRATVCGRCEMSGRSPGPAPTPARMGARRLALFAYAGAIGWPWHGLGRLAVGEAVLHKPATVPPAVPDQSSGRGHESTGGCDQAGNGWRAHAAARTSRRGACVVGCSPARVIPRTAPDWPEMDPCWPEVDHCWPLGELVVYDVPSDERVTRVDCIHLTLPGGCDLGVAPDCELKRPARADIGKSEDGADVTVERSAERFCDAVVHIRDAAEERPMGIEYGHLGRPLVARRAAVGSGPLGLQLRGAGGGIEPQAARL